MPHTSNHPFQFWQVLKRRKIIRVVIAYIAAGVAVIEFVDIVTEPLNLPEWLLTLVIVLVAVGFPIAVIFAWIFDSAAKGVQKTVPSEGIDKQANHEIKTDRARKHENSIAVLPFEDMSPDKDSEYFCDGITEEIINSLTKIKNLHVVARTSAFAFKGKNTDVREIGNKLGVATILEGSVRKSDKQLRITAQLIDIENGYHLWSERFDRELSDVFEIQDEISMQIVNKMMIRVQSHEEEMLLGRHTGNLQAYNFYLQGRYFWNRLTEVGLNKAMEFFGQAIRIDPQYALAYSGISDCYCRLAWYSYSSPEDVFPEAKKAAQKAIELDNQLPEAYTSLGFVSMCFDRDYKNAFQALETAIRLNPGSANAHTIYSICLAITGRHEESIQAGRKALELDPLTPMMSINLGGRYYYARQYDLCIESVRKSMEVDPDFKIAHFYLAYFSNQMQKYKKEALESIHKLIDDFGRKNPAFLSALAIILASSGDREGAEQVLDEIKDLSKENYVSFFWLAIIYVVLGRYDEAFEYFEQAYRTREVLMIFLNVDPIFDRIKPDPRFQSLLRKMNFIG